MIFHLLIRVYSAQSYYTLQGVLLHTLHYRFKDIPCHNVRLTCQSFLVFYLSPFLINGITVPEIIELWRITTVSTICKRFSLNSPGCKSSVLWICHLSSSLSLVFFANSSFSSSFLQTPWSSNISSKMPRQ